MTRYDEVRAELALKVLQLSTRLGEHDGCYRLDQRLQSLGLGEPMDEKRAVADLITCGEFLDKACEALHLPGDTQVRSTR